MEGLDDRRDGLDECDEPAHRHRARTHVAHVARPETTGRHIANELLGLRIERRRPILTEPGDGRDDDEPSEKAASHHHRGDARAEDVADPEECGARLETELRFGQQGNGGRDLTAPESKSPLEESIDGADPDPEEHVPRLVPPNLARDENFRARRAFGVGESSMLAPHEVAPKRHHEEHAEQATGEGDRRHFCEARYDAPEKERWERKDDARSDGRRRGANRLAHVGFEQTALAVLFSLPESEGDDGQNRDGDRR